MNPPTDWKAITATLTATQMVVFLAIADGRSTQDIAALTHKSYKTVEWHVGLIHSKCGTKNRAQIVRIAVAAGLVPVHFELAPQDETGNGAGAAAGGEKA